jgi:hypothetical protein
MFGGRILIEASEAESASRAFRVSRPTKSRDHAVPTVSIAFIPPAIVRPDDGANDSSDRAGEVTEM